MVALTAEDESLISLFKYWQNNNLHKTFFQIKKNLKVLRWKYTYVEHKESVMEKIVICGNYEEVLFSTTSIKEINVISI